MVDSLRFLVLSILSSFEPHPFEFRPANLVVNALIEDKEGKILFCLKKGKLILPGGKVEAGEKYLSALERELLEEISCDFENLTFPEKESYFAMPGLSSISGKLINVIVFTEIQIKDTGKLKAAREIEGIVWLMPEEALNDGRISNATQKILEKSMDLS